MNSLCCWNWPKSMRSVAARILVARHCCPFCTTSPAALHRCHLQRDHREEVAIRTTKCTSEWVDSRIFGPKKLQNSVPWIIFDNFQSLSYTIRLSCDRLSPRHEHPNACRQPTTDDRQLTNAQAVAAGANSKLSSKTTANANEWIQWNEWTEEAAV